MSKVLFSIVLFGVTTAANAFDIEIDRLVVDQKIASLGFQAKAADAEALAHGAQVDHFETIYAQSKVLFEKGVFSKYRLAVVESIYRLTQVRARYFSELSKSLEAQIVFEKSIFQAKQGEASSEQAAAAGLAVSKLNCSLQGLHYEIEDLEQERFKGILDQSLDIVERSPGSVPSHTILKQRADYNFHAELGQGFLESWRSCKQKYGL